MLVRYVSAKMEELSEERREKTRGTNARNAEQNGEKWGEEERGIRQKKKRQEGFGKTHGAVRKDEKVILISKYEK